jgi:hypothetical protein
LRFHAVAWEYGRPFATGRVDAGVYARLVELLNDPWQPVITMDTHQCDLCQYEGPPGRRNLFVPADGAAYLCPQLITHDLNAHAY